MKNRLYCDMKFYRVTKIKPFIEIRKYKSSPRNSVEHKIYSDFIIDWIKYENPLWYKVPFVRKYLTSVNLFTSSSFAFALPLASQFS
jgi:hypothetical protein